uniref:Uncharacterized protein n=1 Tax=Gopherus agassizii TaxID=38772 RepID=A0A452IPJ1_9SAUR
MADDLKRFLYKKLPSVEGLHAILVSDRDGVPVIKVANDNAPEHALRPGFLSTFALATDQGSKLGLSKNKSIICYYNTYQVRVCWPELSYMIFVLFFLNSVLALHWGSIIFKRVFCFPKICKSWLCCIFAIFVGISFCFSASIMSSRFRTVLEGHCVLQQMVPVANLLISTILNFVLIAHHLKIFILKKQNVHIYTCDQRYC